MRPIFRCASVDLAFLMAALLSSCGGGSSSGPTGGPSAEPSPTPTAGGRFDYNGITHVSWWHDEYGSADATSSRSALAATGGNWAGLLMTWYMERQDSSLIAPDSQSTPTDDVVRHAIDEMHALGLKVMLKPHVDVLDGVWRGTITPGNPSAWFESYAEFITHFAAVAREENVEMLCIGTELATMTDARYAGSWSNVITRIRALYSGPLTYAANAVTPGDEFTSVSFWPQMDLLGLDVYTPLTDKTNPTREELVAGWRRNRDGHDMVTTYRNFQGAYSKPVIFTEIGYRSADGTNRAPWDWQASMGPDPGEQADCYAAMYEVWGRETSWMKGPFWWAWNVPAPQPGDTDYNPRGKPAEDVLKQWQRR